MNRKLIEEAEAYIRELFRTDAGGHDAEHTLRVYRTAMELAWKEPPCDPEITALAALLHDADDHKLFHTENNANARGFLAQHEVPDGQTEKICAVINAVSFSQNRDVKPETIEAAVVQDADRLDAIGAIGIARAFAYGGEHGRPLQDSVKHFYEKLLLLKDLMNTEAAKRIAEERHAFLEAYLKELRKECGETVSMDQTLAYYEENAEKFAEGTVLADMETARERFLRSLPKNALILDFGCGSGRDTKAFLLKGYEVEAVDGSEELCRLASAYTGIPVKHMLFRELSAVSRYDGIWACASILHLEKTELTEVLKKISAAMKQRGVLYASFKYGTFEGMRSGRYFTDFTEKTIMEMMKNIPSLQAVDLWITQDVRPGREKEQWINILARRN